MDKFVNESLDSYLSERSWGDADNPGGPIRNAAKALRSAPARALRRKRARKIMGKYKDKIQGRIDDIFSRYTKNLDTIESKIQDRIDRVKTSSLPDDAKANQFEDILDSLRSSMEGVLKSARDTANEYVKTYAESFDKRLERPGTITGTEFMPEDKTDLLAEWKGIESEINYYIETKLLDFLDYISIEGLSEIKGELKKFIEDQKGYYHGFGGGHVSDIGSLTSTDIPVYERFRDTLGGTLDTTMLITSPTSFPNNKAGAKYVQFIIEGGQFGYQFLEKSTRKSGKPYIPISKFFPVGTADYVNTLKKIALVTNII